MMMLIIMNAKSANRCSNTVDPRTEQRTGDDGMRDREGTLTTWADPYGLIHAGLACISRAQHDRMLASSSYVGEQAINIRRRTT